MNMKKYRVVEFYIDNTKYLALKVPSRAKKEHWPTNWSKKTNPSNFKLLQSKVGGGGREV